MVSEHAVSYHRASQPWHLPVSPGTVVRIHISGNEETFVVDREQ